MDIITGKTSMIFSSVSSLLLSFYEGSHKATAYSQWHRDFVFKTTRGHLCPFAKKFYMMSEGSNVCEGIMKMRTYIIYCKIHKLEEFAKRMKTVS